MTRALWAWASGEGVGSDAPERSGGAGDIDVLDWLVRGSVAGASRAGQSRVDHGRSQARRRERVPAAARRWRQYHAALSQLSRRGEAAPGGAQPPAQGLRSPDPG